MSEKIVITVNEGKIRGLKRRSNYCGVEYYSFLGVPYGQSTAGKARFKDPVKVKPWNNILDATVEKSGCIQFSIRKRMITGNEDCLYNNIHISGLPPKEDPLKAVVVNIHPGGFFHGSADPHYYGSPEFFIDRDIVSVFVAHRLHILGYLNLGLEECSGNQALKDIILSLKWIKENIKAFGGDPNNITVLGSSSGASLVHCLLLSPQANGLFHKAVMMGMYAFSPVLYTKEENVTLAYKIAHMLGYQGELEDKKKLLKFFKNLKMEALLLMKLETFYNEEEIRIYPCSPFMPTPDPGEQSVLPDSFEKLIPITKRIPLMIGFCEREAAMGLPFVNKLNSTNIPKRFYNAIRQNVWGWGAHLSDDDLQSIQHEVEAFYTNGEPTAIASQDTKCDILTDIALSGVYDSLINVISADLPSSVFVYKFKYTNDLCVMKKHFQKIMEHPLKGTYHAADFAFWVYIADHIGKNVDSFTPQDREVIDTFVNLITTFAKTGDPNYEGMKVQWKPTTPENPSLLHIDDTLEVQDELFNEARMKFWHNLIKQYKKDTSSE